MGKVGRLGGRRNAHHLHEYSLHPETRVESRHYDGVWVVAVVWRAGGSGGESKEWRDGGVRRRGDTAGEENRARVWV